MKNIIDIFTERGFIEQVTHENELREYLGGGSVSCYVGFDPTAESLHVGHLIPIMALSHMQKNNHRPIALVGGGTGLIGDPSGKTEMRKMLSKESINTNVNSIKNQLSRFINFENDQALLVNNAEWLEKLLYIPLLRDIGKHFSVNKMIRAESYRKRLDSDEGLSLIEFNYMVLQSYDFLKLYQDYGCKLQMGGSDQWGNIISGIDLIRKKCQASAYGITFPLITTANGKKMGKTEKGAIWLDREKTSPYDYYQFWVNTDDRDVLTFLKLFTFLPIDEIDAVRVLDGSDLNSVKRILAFEATVLAHGNRDAQNAYSASIAVFGPMNIPIYILPSSNIPRNATGSEDTNNIPTQIIKSDELGDGIPAFNIFKRALLCRGSSEARRLINQGGAYINGNRLMSIDTLITKDTFIDGELLLRAGKKRYQRFILIP